MLATILAPALLLLARAMPSLAQTTEGVMTIQTSMPSNPISLDETGMMSILPISYTDSFSASIPTELLSSIASTVSDAGTTGVMSIPAGETPITTSSSDTTLSTSSGTTSSSSSATSSAPPEQSSGAAAPGQGVGHGIPLLAAVFSGLSFSFGFAWLLL